MAANRTPEPSRAPQLDAALLAERQRAHRLEQMLDLSPALIGSLEGPEHVLTYANHQVERAFGSRVTRGRPLRETLQEAVLKDDCREILAKLDQVYQTGEPYEGREMSVSWKQVDGTPLATFFNVTFQPVRDADGHVSGILAYAIDVTTQVKAQRKAERTAAELKRSEAKLLKQTEETVAAEYARELANQKAFAENLIQNVSTGIAYLDRDLVFRVANPVYSSFLEMSPDQILGRHVFDVVPGGEAQIGPLLRRVLETGEPYYNSELEFIYLTPQGQPRTTYWDFVYYPLRHDEASPVDGIFVLANEISERMAQRREQQRMRADQARLQRERIEALELSDRLKDQFLSILSHELRTPVNAIMGFGSILDDEVAGPMTAEQHRYLSKILQGSERLLALIDDLLDMSRIEAGKFTLNPMTMRFSEVCEEVVSTLLPLAQQRELTLVAEVSETLPPIQADPQRVGQVLTNLVNNAIKFTPPGGRITVRASLDDHQLRCEVRDTGIGIAPEDVPKLFQRFTQLDMSSTRQVGGTGLGLSISKALIEAHGGSIGVHSEPEIGSTFWFSLPSQPAASAEAPPPRPDEQT